MMKGIEFLGKHSYKDFGLSIAPGKSIGIPEKEKIIVKVPFNNKEYDFSQIYGSQPYTSRELTYPFNVFTQGRLTKESMNNKKTQVLNWLMNSNGKQKLLDDSFPGYYFLAEVEGGTSFEENYNTGILTVTFKAYPFMVAELPEGNNLWETFNLKLDVLQDVEFEIDGQKEVTLINTGTPDVFPTIQSTEEMQLTLNGKSYNVNAGTTQKADIPLSNGENNLTIAGNGTIKFIFHKEMI